MRGDEVAAVAGSGRTAERLGRREAGGWGGRRCGRVAGLGAAVTPIRPPATPLIVRQPYVSTWVRSQTLAGTWPTFWNGWVKAIAGLVRVDGVPYVFFGTPTGFTGAAPALLPQTGLEVTATRSRFTWSAAGVRLSVDFLSPIEPTDLRRQSVPFGFLSAAVRMPTAVATGSASTSTSPPSGRTATRTRRWCGHATSCRRRRARRRRSA